MLRIQREWLLSFDSFEIGVLINFFDLQINLTHYFPFRVLDISLTF